MSAYVINESVARSEPQGHTEQAAGQFRIIAVGIAEDIDRSIMLLCNLSHNRQSQAAAGSMGAQNPIKPLEYMLPFRQRNAGAGIFHFQNCVPGRFIDPGANSDAALRRRVVQGIVEQIA